MALEENHFDWTDFVLQMLQGVKQTVTTEGRQKLMCINQEETKAYTSQKKGISWKDQVSSSLCTFY